MDSAVFVNFYGYFNLLAVQVYMWSVKSHQDNKYIIWYHCLLNDNIFVIGSAIYTICETLISDEKTSVIALVGHLPNNLAHPFCETGIILFYFSSVFLLFFYETLRSAKVLRFVLQSSIIYFIIDLVVTQGNDMRSKSNTNTKSKKANIVLYI